MATSNITADVGPDHPAETPAEPSDDQRVLCVLHDPVQRVCSLYERAGETGPLARAIAERGWTIADVYRELSGAGPKDSELHALFADFFNGQARALIAAWTGDEAKLAYWAGMPQRGVALRDRALELLAVHDVVGTDERLDTSRSQPPARAVDPETRALILAHNEIDAELHAHYASAPRRHARRSTADRSRAGESHDGEAVCVLGMSRSGTSLTTRILNVLGVSLGREENLMAPVAGNNPKGFWENKAIVNLNEDILGEFTGKTPSPRPMWHRPPPLPDGWERDPRLRPHRNAARAILRENFANTPLWGWKDPRVCLTLPFWQMLIPRIRYVICVRHPLDAAASLHARDGVPYADGLWLWLLYTSHAVLNTRGQQRTFVAHESYFPSWERQAERLSGFVGNGPISGGQRSAIADHLDDRLWHHRDGARQDGELPAEARTLYRLLATLSELGPQATTEAALDEAAARGAAAAQA